MESKELEVVYYRAKDYLYLHVVPRRPAVMEETNYEFYIRYDYENTNEIVGFEWLGFSDYFSAIDEPGVIPDLPLRFNIEGADLKGLTLRQVLYWAYRRYVLRLPSPRLERMAVDLAPLRI